MQEHMSLSPEKRLSVVIPCYNEAKTIHELLERVLRAPTPGWQKEIIVVDDASKDGTPAILKTFESQLQVVYRAQNGGKGSAVRDAIARTTGTYVLIQDADLEYDPEEIQYLLVALDTTDAEVVYGSRNLRPRERAGALIPRAGVWFITKLMNMLYGLSLTDVWTCYKLFPRDAAGDFMPGKFESELLFTASLAQRGYTFVEIPISYHPRAQNEGKKIRYRDGIIAIAAILVDWFQKYGTYKTK